MTVRRTNTNPSGLPMERVNISIPVENKFKMERIANDQHKYVAVCYREAVQEYIKKYNSERQQKIMKATYELAIEELKKDFNKSIYGD